MISEDEIERKDFGFVLPDISLKLVAVSQALRGDWKEVDPIDKEALHGFGIILEDVKEDIDTIHEALYLPDEEQSQELSESKE